MGINGKSPAFCHPLPFLFGIVDFATHNVSHLDNKLFRRDHVRFAEKE